MTFDPYQQWLQIPHDRRPPTYYDLLGLPAGENDPDCIRRAASERYDLVRRYVLSPQGADAQRILAELSQAVSCLTHPEQKRQYDAGQASVTMRTWLNADRDPADFYELLGQPRFNCDGTCLLGAIATARRVLAEADGTPAAQRAAKLRRLIDLAETAVSDRTVFANFHRAILVKIKQQYAAAHGDQESLWHLKDLEEWLQREQRVYAQQARIVALALCSSDAESQEVLLEMLFPAQRDAQSAAEAEEGMSEPSPLGSPLDRPAHVEPKDMDLAELLAKLPLGPLGPILADPPQRKVLFGSAAAAAIGVLILGLLVGAFAGSGNSVDFPPTLVSQETDVAAGGTGP